MPCANESRAHIDPESQIETPQHSSQALAVGVTGSMSREQWRVFNATGTTHLVAISGLHVTLFAVVAFAAAEAVVRVLYRFVPWRRENFTVYGHRPHRVTAVRSALTCRSRNRQEQFR